MTNRLVSIVGNTNDLRMSMLLALANEREGTSELVRTMRDKEGLVIDAALRSSLRGTFAAELREFVSSLAVDRTGSDSDLDEDDGGEGDEEEQLSGGGPNIRDVYARALVARGRSLITGRRIAPTSGNGRLLAWLGSRVPDEAVLRELGRSALVRTAATSLTNALGRYVRGLRGRYSIFRRERTREKRWYTTHNHQLLQWHPHELDAVLLATLRAGRAALGASRSRAGQADVSLLPGLQPFAELLVNQVLVDEATDFSPLQLACMMALTDPATGALVACGDFNQRLTEWGTSTVEAATWAIPNVTVHPIRITYRHTKPLNVLAHSIAALGTARSDAILPELVETDGPAPVLGRNLNEPDAIATWLGDRIEEVERSVQSLPTIAILVSDIEGVDVLAERLGKRLETSNIRVTAFREGADIGRGQDVRVFDVQHVKGLEFEAVFFVGADALVARHRALFDKYLYVGATRAAAFLGITTNGGDLPVELVSLADQFEERFV